jgi:hypothetical protein
MTPSPRFRPDQPSLSSRSDVSDGRTAEIREHGGSRAVEIGRKTDEKALPPP